MSGFRVVAIEGHDRDQAVRDDFGDEAAKPVRVDFAARGDRALPRLIGFIVDRVGAGEVFENQMPVACRFLLLADARAIGFLRERLVGEFEPRLDAILRGGDRQALKGERDAADLIARGDGREDHVIVEQEERGGPVTHAAL